MQQRPDTGFHEGAMISGGIIGAFGGSVGGAYGGALLESGLSGGCRGEFGCLGGAVLDFLITEPAAVAAGVHWANHSRGAYGTEFMANLGILFAGIAIASQAGGGAIFLAVPITQIAASIAIEKATSPRPD